MLHDAVWKVHHNSNRLGIRLIGPKPVWARRNGGEGGSHPSNVHDEEYCVGTVNFTGDMPVLITHDGPSLGGFVCPLTIPQFDLWKVGQIKAGDAVKFKLTDLPTAISERVKQDRFIQSLQCVSESVSFPLAIDTKAVLYTVPPGKKLEDPATTTCYEHPGMAVRLQGDRHILVEYGPMELDLTLRLRVHLFSL